MSDAVLARFDDPAARICSTGIAFEHLRFVEAMHGTVSTQRTPGGGLTVTVDLPAAS